MQRRLHQLASALLMFCVLNASASVLYVDLNCPTPTPPYTNWFTAATNIQDAVDAANPGDQILVTNGVYQTGGSVSSGSNRVAVLSALTVQSVNGPAVTVINGYQVPGTTNGTSAVRCVYLANGATLSGFTLTNGATPQTTGNNRGGGVYCQSTNTIVTNCVITGDATSGSGGGAYSGTLINCTIANNSAASSGGGAYTGTLNNCLVTGNSASYGGAVDSSVFPLQTILNNCTICSNSASVVGGGLFSAGSAAPSYLFTTNCIVMGNIAPTGSNYYFGVGSELTLNYCCTAPIPANGTGNISSDPQFVDPLDGNYHLQSTSPCINAGTSNAVESVDLDGNPRIVGGFVDMGAYEYQLPAPVPVIPSIQATYTGVSPGVIVGFTGQIAGHPTSSCWDFGDGTVISNQLPSVSHSWLAQGDYTAALRAYNDSYPNGVSATVIIHVLENPLHYVSQTSTNPVAPYLSWDEAATNIQDAVDAAYVDGTVLVTNGVYSTGGRAVIGLTGTAQMNRVSVTKQITIRSVNGPAVTVIQGNTGSGAVRCVYLTNNTMLAGFTLTNGLTDASGYINDVRVQSGGGVFSESSGVVISNCVLVGNSAYIEGGGAYSGTLINCLLVNNSVTAGEGGGASANLENCILIGNSADDGGGAWGGTLNNCILISNTAAEDGGGASISTLNNCIAYYNTAPSGSNYDVDFGPCTLNYCATTPLPTQGVGNITAEPVFVNLAGGDFHPQSNSPCINAGNNSYVVTST